MAKTMTSTGYKNKTNFPEKGKIRLQDMQTEMKYSDKYVSDYLGISYYKYKNIKRIQKGNKHIDNDCLKKLCDLFMCTTDYMLGNVDRRNELIIDGKRKNNPITDFSGSEIAYIIKCLQEDDRFRTNLHFLLHDMNSTSRNIIINGFNETFDVIRRNASIEIHRTIPAS